MIGVCPDISLADARVIRDEANMVLKRMGYNGKATGHGFRDTMSTILHEKGFNSAWIETQLVHKDKIPFVEPIIMLSIWKEEGK